MLSKFIDQTVLIHMKDGVCRQVARNDGMKDGLLDMKIDLLPLGTGDLPIQKLVEIAEASGHVSTIIVELDYCNVEMYQALEQSYKFVVGNGICAGNK